MRDCLGQERQRYLFAPCTIVFFTVFALSLITPKYADDFAYSFSFATDCRIQSVIDILPSMVIHREIINGRVIPHFLVQVFLMLPKVFFAFFNALNTIIVLILSSKILRVKQHNMYVGILMYGIFSIWVFSPAFGENYLWLDGAINYSWAIGVLLLFLWPYASDYLDLPDTGGIIKNVLHAAIAFLAGAWSENASLVFIVIALCLMVITWKKSRKVKPSLMISTLLALIGYCFLMSAPATSGRSGVFSLGTMAGNIRTILLLTERKILLLYLIAASLLALTLLLNGSRKRILLAILFIFAGIVSLLCFSFAAYFVDRHFSCTVFLTTLASMVLMDELFYLKKSDWNVVLIGGLTVVFLLRFPIGTIDILASKHAEQEREQLIREAIAEGTKTVTITNYYTATKYALPFILDAPDNWINMTVASYYGLDTVFGVNPDE